MAVRILKPPSLCALTSRLQPRQAIFEQRRRFLSNPLEPSTQNIQASRTLPYPTLAVYEIIADIERYPEFIPYCESAKITEWSNKDTHYQRKWPQEATLTVGYKNTINETFCSRIYCAPPVPEQGRAGLGVVEALSGEAEEQLDGEMTKHHDHRSRSDGGFESHPSNLPGGSPLSLLHTRWTVKSFPFKPAPDDDAAPGDKHGQPPQEATVEPQPAAKEMTDVSLSIQYKFSNSMYEMMSKAVAPKLADVMIAAFERRVRSLLDK